MKPLEKGGDPYAPENIQALCRGCHIAKTWSEKPGYSPELEAQRAAWRALVVDLSGSSGQD